VSGGRDVQFSYRRRALLQQGGAFTALAACGLLLGREVQAAEDELVFGAASMKEALEALGSVPTSASQIVLTAPDRAENGAIVPVTVESRLPGTQDIFIVVEANPNPMVVRFTVPEGTDPWVSTRIKVAESSKVYAIVRADGRLYSVSRDTQVTVGGCA
jgi:sulfur-oxidizing protein SoxY